MKSKPSKKQGLTKYWKDQAKYYEARLDEVIREYLKLAEILENFAPPPELPKSPSGWEKLEHCPEWHYFDKGVSLCRHWMGGAWPVPIHDVNDPENCAECAKFVRAGNTKLVNPFRP